MLSEWDQNGVDMPQLSPNPCSISPCITKMKVSLRACSCNDMLVSTKLALADTNLGWKTRSVFHITGLYKEQDKSIMVCGSLVTTEKVLTMPLLSLFFGK